MGAMGKPVFLLSDFGLSDHYVGIMKAVILSRCPGVGFVDLTHEIPPQGIAQGCYVLESVWEWIPVGGVVLAVVDPGVGTVREPAVFFHHGKFLVGPNNGLFGFLPDDLEGRVLDVEDHWLARVSSTFHGRDVFAPCAAYLAAGGNWTHLGRAVTVPVRLPVEDDPVAVRGSVGRIVYFDHFGNAVTNITGDGVERGALVEIAGRVQCAVVDTYAEAGEAEVLAYVGSTGRLEVAVRNGSAQRELGLKLGERVTLTD